MILYFKLLASFVIFTRELNVLYITEFVMFTNYGFVFANL